MALKKEWESSFISEAYFDKAKDKKPINYLH